MTIQTDTYGGIAPEEITNLSRTIKSCGGYFIDMLGFDEYNQRKKGGLGMPTSNLYWPVYKNLEKEVLKLADYIHFSDDQLGTYSMFIADLIVRCSVEIEALSKELYCMLGGNMSPTDS